MEGGGRSSFVSVRQEERRLVSSDGDNDASSRLYGWLSLVWVHRDAVCSAISEQVLKSDVMLVKVGEYQWHFLTLRHLQHHETNAQCDWIISKLNLAFVCLCLLFTFHETVLSPDSSAICGSVGGPFLMFLMIFLFFPNEGLHTLAA